MNRTVKNAGEVVEIPTQLATITTPQYQNSISLHQEGNAYLQPLVSTADLTYQGDRLYFNKNMAASLALIKDYATNTIPEDLDLPFLQLCFSIILANFNVTMLEDNTINQVISIYYPKFSQAIGNMPNTNRSNVERFIDKIMSYQTVVGVIGREVQPVLIYNGEDVSKNVIYISSPYLVRVIQNIYQVSIRHNKKGQTLQKSDGTPNLLPSYSYLVKSSIIKERNKRAVINVMLIVAVIERAGKGIPHISAKTLIERNEQLKSSLEGKPTRTQNLILSRVFTKTWELLRDQTTLRQVYKNIQLPDPNDVSCIPTTKTLDMVFSFQHSGK